VKQVSKPTVQQVQKSIAKITTQVVEKVVQVPTNLITESAVEVPQVQVIEVLKQTASGAQQQRIVQTGVMWEQAVSREAVVERTEAARSAGRYEAGIVSVREGPCTPIGTHEYFVGTHESTVGTRTFDANNSRGSDATLGPQVFLETTVPVPTIGADRAYASFARDHFR